MQEYQTIIPKGDAPSIILKCYIMHDSTLAADCIEYFARTGKLYPGTAWLKEKLL